MRDLNAPLARLSFVQIARAVATASRTPVELILGRGRSSKIIIPRVVLVRLLRQRGLSFAQIGRKIGRDHTTVLHHWRRSENDLHQGGDRAGRIMALERGAVEAAAAMAATLPSVVFAVKSVRSAALVAETGTRGGFLDTDGAIICNP